MGMEKSLMWLRPKLHPQIPLPINRAKHSNSNKNIRNGPCVTLKNSGFSHVTPPANCFTVNYTWKGWPNAAAAGVTVRILNELPASSVTHCLPAGNWFSSAAVLRFDCLAHAMGLNQNKNNDTLTLLGLLFPPNFSCLEFRNHSCWHLDLTLILQNSGQLIH